MWQMLRFLGLTRGEAGRVTRRLVRVYRGVYAVRELDELGWFRAATLALGPDASLSHLSAAMLLGLRPYRPHAFHVSLPGNGGRAHAAAGHTVVRASGLHVFHQPALVVAALSSRLGPRPMTRL